MPHVNENPLLALTSSSLRTYFFLGGCNSPPAGQGLLIHEVSRSHTTTHHTRYDSSGRMIGPTQRPLPGNTYTHTHTKQTSMPPVGFEPTTSAGEQPQTYAFDRAATGTGSSRYRVAKMEEQYQEGGKLLRFGITAGFSLGSIKLRIRKEVVR